MSELQNEPARHSGGLDENAPGSASSHPHHSREGEEMQAVEPAAELREVDYDAWCAARKAYLLHQAECYECAGLQEVTRAHP
jgi:hypothetical protein